jgi:uncharacterized protein YndB with AHSA1/START domain
MKKILITLAILVVVLIGVLLGYAASQPDTLRVERSIGIAAPPGIIFAYMNDFRRSRDWSPYEQKDPDMKRELSGAPMGVGAVYAWEGDENVGAGRMEILESMPNSKIVIQLDFFEPMEGRNMVEYTFVPDGDTTRVTWTMSGPMNFVSKLMCAVIDMDAMIGKDFETGLQQLKSVTEQ